MNEMLDKITIQMEIVGECWLWTGSISVRGRPIVCHKGKQSFAHRESYRLFKGDIPDGMYVCHTCDIPRCVNPKHLFLGT